MQRDDEEEEEEGRGGEGHGGDPNSQKQHIEYLSISGWDF